IRFVCVFGGGGYLELVMRTFAMGPVVGNQLSLFAAVIRAPEFAAVSLFAIQRHTIACLNQDVNAFGVARGNRGHDLAGHSRRQTIAGKTFPGDTSVSRLEQAATRPATVAAPRVKLERPHARIQDFRIVRIHLEVGTAAVLISKQHSCPSLAGVRGAEHTAFSLWAIRVAQRSDENYVRILRIDYDTADAARLFQSHQRPRFAGVDGFVDSLAHRDMTANPWFACAGPHDVWIAGRNRERADG